jgi:hypothetical protein
LVYMLHFLQMPVIKADNIDVLVPLARVFLMPVITAVMNVASMRKQKCCANIK